MKNNSLKKRKDENENQYLWRIGNMIDDGYIKNWQSIVSVINSQLHNDKSKYKGESAYRKKYAAARQFYNDVFSKRSDDKQLEDLERRIYELNIERQKLNAAKIELSRKQRQDARLELFYENIGKEIKRYPEPPRIVSQQFVKIHQDCEQYVLTIADIHYGANFVTENNSYSIDECCNRFKRLLAQTVDFIIKRNLTQLTVINLGDELQGLLRMTDLQLNETAVVKAVVGVSRLLADFLNELSCHCKVDYYSVPRSNHTQTRPLGSKANEMAAEDVTYIINNYVSDILNDNYNVTIHIGDDRSYTEIPIFDYKVIALHGHGVKNIETFLRDMSAYKREFIDYAFLGHLHNYKVTTGNSGLTYDTEVIVCPSFVGADPYSESLMKSSKPSCMIFGFDETHGLNETHKIILN